MRAEVAPHAPRRPALTVFNVEPAATIDDTQTRVDRCNLAQCLVGDPYNHQDFNVATRHSTISPSLHCADAMALCRRNSRNFGLCAKYGDGSSFAILPQNREARVRGNL